MVEGVSIMASTRQTRKMPSVKEETEGLLEEPMAQELGTHNITPATSRPNSRKKHFLVTPCQQQEVTSHEGQSHYAEGDEDVFYPSSNNNNVTPPNIGLLRTRSDPGVRVPMKINIPKSMPILRQSSPTSTSPRTKTFTVTNYGNIDNVPCSPTGSLEIGQPASPSLNASHIELDLNDHSPTSITELESKPITRKISVLGYDDGTVPEILVEEVPDVDVPDAIWMPKDTAHLGLPSIPEVVTNGYLPHVDDHHVYQTHSFKFPEKYNASITKGFREAEQIARLGRLYAGRKVDRIVNKDGRLNISYKNTKSSPFLADIFTTLVEVKWRYTLLIFILGFVLSWFVFAVFWYITIVAMPKKSNSTEEEISYYPCVDGVTDFHTSLLFSIETQHTIGYGTRAANSNCPWSTALLMFQSIFGVIVQCIMAGVVFAKLAKPKRRAHTIMFSKSAVICQEDGEYCLQFRVGDMRRSQLIGGVIHAMLIKKHVTKEGITIPFEHYHLDIQAMTCSPDDDHDQYIFLAWPARIIHRINEKSPFYGMSSEDLLKQDFEIIIILEGVVESTGGTTQVRTSYLPAEIKWGQQLDPLLTYIKHSGSYEIDYGDFHKTMPCHMPDVSARDHALTVAATKDKLKSPHKNALPVSVFTQL